LVLAEVGMVQAGDLDGDIGVEVLQRATGLLLRNDVGATKESTCPTRLSAWALVVSVAIVVRFRPAPSTHP
jgi:hypothetical protein